ncbi:YncE family protein [Crossiella cryophila]|uniref:Uncharacterized protein n=1 Tax=Crossiella cryophila TaxID=43355 RepID=A0A7W7FRS0_9PSEU|nr:hypothetical protein [Crossiella cryophila]MBB4675427.1 hypothetical protein [Crossiella cryophila]
MTLGESAYATRHTRRRLAPLPDGWLTINESNDRLIRLSGSGAAEVVADFGSWEIDPADETAAHGRERGVGLHTSADGRFAAVTDDYGWHASVVDLAAGREVFTLRRGEGWDSWTVPFGVAFLPGNSLIAQTDWNRIDAFNLPSGELLTGDEPGSDGERRDRSFEYLGALHASPTGRWLIVDGWFWHPDTWDVPVAWLDEDTVAVQWLNSHSTAATFTDLFHAPTGEQTKRLYGLQGPMWGHQGKLYVSGSAGLETWHPESGRIEGLVAGIRPTAHNPATGGFAELVDGTLRTFHPASGVVSTPIAHYGA